MRTLVAGALVSLSALGGAALAQEAPPYDPAIDLQLFEYAVGPKTFFTVADADVARARQLSLDAFVTFLTNPFVVYDVDPAEPMLSEKRTRVVSSLITAELSGAWGLSDRLQLGVALPVVSMSGDGLDPTTAMPLAGGLAQTGLGDLRLEAKLRLWARGTLRVAGLVGLSVPTSFGSGGSDFLGDDLPALRARLAAQWTAGRISLGLNAGALARKSREIYASEIGPQLVWGAAASLRLTERFSVIGETFGRAGLPATGVDSSPIEVEGGLRVFINSSLALVAGGGTGLSSGIGSPELRVFSALGYAPDTRDSDGDGVVNGRDGCVNEPEDKDRWQDADGCPEPDNDGDRRADGDDQCPAEAEDLDGFDDDDGCPEPDNDGDGIADLDDRCAEYPEDKQGQFPADGCPITRHDADGDGLVDAIDQCVMDAEDTDSFEDGDGCPDDDQDKDGVDDAADQCPVCAEDKDGNKDDDGCPELDADSDGIEDSVDQCPAEAEVINSLDDFDGCPDEGGAVIATFDGERILVERAPEFDRKGLTKLGALIVDQVASVMLTHPEVTTWLVALADPKERTLARRAQWVRAALERRGVPAQSIELMSAVGSAKLVAVAKERRADEQAAVCPAPEVLPRPERQTPKPVPPGPPPVSQGATLKGKAGAAARPPAPPPSAPASLAPRPAPTTGAPASSAPRPAPTTGAPGAVTGAPAAGVPAAAAPATLPPAAEPAPAAPSPAPSQPAPAKPAI